MDTEPDTSPAPRDDDDASSEEAATVGHSDADSQAERNRDDESPS